MSTAYPGAIDSFTNPTSGDTLAAVPHAQQHADVNDAVEAIEGALGTSPQGGSATVKARLDGVDTALSGKEAAGVAAAAVSTHAALTQTHGISAFGATVVDDADAATARATLGAASNAREGVETLGSDTISANFATQAEKQRTMAGAVTVNGTGYAAGLDLGLTLINNTGGALAVSVTAMWNWYGSAAPTTVAAGKKLRIVAVSRGTTEGEVAAAWSVTP